MASALWRRIADDAIRAAGFRCSECRRAPEADERGVAFEVHHKTYARFGGKERPEDLAVLCTGRFGCHRKVHSFDWWKRRRFA